MSVLDAASAKGSKRVTELTLEKPFEGTGSFADWAGSITTGLAILILISVFLIAVFEKQRSWPSMTKYLCFAGLCVLPIFMMLFGIFTTFEGSKKVQFCHSCHSAMDLYVNDMKNRESTTLAAIHYNNRYILEKQCYRCHADYGVWGTVEARHRGLSHVYYWVTNSATARGEQQIRSYEVYQNSLCLQCHSGSRSFLQSANGVHITVSEALLQNDGDTGAPTMPCLSCHGPAHPSLSDSKITQRDTR